jgi:hypothetical protein
LSPAATRRIGRVAAAALNKRGESVGAWPCARPVLSFPTRSPAPPRSRDLHGDVCLPALGQCAFAHNGLTRLQAFPRSRPFFHPENCVLALGRHDSRLPCRVHRTQPLRSPSQSHTAHPFRRDLVGIQVFRFNSCLTTATLRCARTSSCRGPTLAATRPHRGARRWLIRTW